MLVYSLWVLIQYRYDQLIIIALYYYIFLFSTQVARAGRFGTKGLAITFVSDEKDAQILNQVQDRFEVNITELPDEIDVTTYSEWCVCAWWALIRNPTWGISQ